MHTLAYRFHLQQFNSWSLTSDVHVYVVDAHSSLNAHHSKIDQVLHPTVSRFLLRRSYSG